MISKKEGIILSILSIIGIISFFYDEFILLFVNSFKNNVLDIILGLFTSINTISIILILLVIVLFLYRKDTRKWFPALVYTVLGSSAVSFLLKGFIQRSRPFGMDKMFFGLLPDYSFPSGHAMVIFSMLPILDREYPKLKIIWLILAILIAFSRIYFNIHYLSDVLFGMVLGYIIGLIFVKLKENKKI